MKRQLLISSVLLLTFFNVLGQETIVPGINASKFNGVSLCGHPEQYLYIPAFIKAGDDKKNFSLSNLEPNTLMEENKAMLELPTGYQLLSASFSGANHILFFYDESKKEDVILSVTGENVNKKKTIKHNGDSYIALNSEIPEYFIYVTIDKKGNYEIKKVDLNLETIAEKSYSAPSGTNWDIISVNTGEQGIKITRKESKSDNKYAFAIHTIDPNELSDIDQQTLGNEDIAAYPTFFKSNEGMNYSGGYYYNDGKYTGKPDGVYFAMLSPDGRMEQTAKVPFSQVIEDIKTSEGEKLVKANTSITFVDGFMSPENQSFVLIGQLFTRNDNEGGSKITMGGIVTVNFSEEMKYMFATATDIESYSIELKGNLKEVNNLDLGVWLNNASLLPYKFRVNRPGYPLVAYQSITADNMVNLCFVTIGVKGKHPESLCSIINREPIKKNAYSFNGIKAAQYPAHTYGILRGMHEAPTTLYYQLNNDMLVFYPKPFPPLEDISVNFEPDMVSLHPINEEQPDEQENAEEPTEDSE